MPSIVMLSVVAPMGILAADLFQPIVFVINLASFSTVF